MPLALCGCSGTINDLQGSPSAPIILGQPVSQTAFVGQSAGFAVSVLSAGQSSYQWYRNGAAVPGATGNSYTVSVVSAADNGDQIYVTIANPYGSTTSKTVSLTVAALSNIAATLACSESAPAYGATISLTPAFGGGTAVLGSNGTGSSDIAAAPVSGTTYTTPPITAATTYTLTLTGGTSPVTASCKATPTGVTLNSVLPSGTTIAPGTQAFTANVAGGVTDAVVWSASGGSFSGNVWTTPTAAGSYVVTATSADEPSVHSSVGVTVSAPVIGRQPAAVAICSGSATTLAVTASYASSYQWNRNGQPIDGATSASYMIPSAAAMDAGSYTVTVSNAAGSSVSLPATVTVGTSIVTQPVSTTLSLLQSATLSIAVQGKSPYNYQWYVQQPNAAGFKAVPGGTGASYSVTAVSGMSGTAYQATVKDSCGVTVASAPAILTVRPSLFAPTITQQPANQAVFDGFASAQATLTQTAVFSAQAVGSPPLTYRWYRVPAGTSSAVAIPGATANAYSVPSSASLTTDDQDGYYVVVSNPYGQAVSQTAQLAVDNGISIDSENQPETVFGTDGQSASFTVEANSPAPLTYQWFVAAPGSSTFNAVPGATQETLTLPAPSVADSGSVYEVVIGNGLTAPVTSATAGLFVDATQQIVDLCGPWFALGTATPAANCSYQLTPAKANQRGGVVWPFLEPTGNVSISFTVTSSLASATPGDGFALVFGDPSQGATTGAFGAAGRGLGAQGVPGLAVVFDDDSNAMGTPAPFVGVTGSSSAAWGNPWFSRNTVVGPFATPGQTIAHTYNVTVLDRQMNVTMDGLEVFSGQVNLPPVAYVYLTSATGANDAQTVIGNLLAVFNPE